jgi:hypothetical protein
VFANCKGGVISLPQPVPANLPPIFTADRDYQTAAAYFYAGEYDTAAVRFAAIAEDRSSPWQPKGRYLIARTLIRRATIVEQDKTIATALLQKADAELAAITGDPAQASMRGAAQSLRDWVTIRLHPESRLSAAAQELISQRPSAQAFVDYQRLVDRVIDPSGSYEYSGLKAVAQADDLTDWITAMQGRGNAAQARAVSQWKVRQTLPWLIAALWRVDPNSTDAGTVLAAAAAVPSSSPAYASALFLRTRLLLARGNLAGARAVLATAPDTARSGFSLEALNLVRSQRLRAAGTFDEALRYAPRTPVGSADFPGSMELPTAADPFTKPVFDADAAIMFTEQFPLSRLKDAVVSPALPTRLRIKVAVAAWTRAVELRDDAAGLAVAPILQSLAPSIAHDMDAYVHAADAERRHYAGVLLIARWAGIRNYVPLSEDHQSYLRDEPRRAQTFDFVDPDWWCGFTPSRRHAAGPYRWSSEEPITALPDLVVRNRQGVPPAFLSASERTRATSELQRLAALGSGPTYLATESVAWARKYPRDPDVAEALALAVSATGDGCSDDGTANASRNAFAALHKLFPRSAWAKKTPYWYEGR